MAKVTRFEDLICWQKARALVKQVYALTNREPLSRDFKLRDQLRSASVSAMSNIAEGFARFHKKDFIRFLDIAQSSASEVKSLLYIIIDQDHGNTDEIQKIQRLAVETQKITLGLLKYVKNSIDQPANLVKEPPSLYGEPPNFNGLELPDKFIKIST